MNTYATIKQQPEDFIVHEIIDFPLTGDGEHLWCYVEKRNMNTAYLKREWARLLDCPGKLISHSGLKDRHAVTRQWLCLPAKVAENLPNSGDNWQIIEHSLHQKKLRIGTHRRNHFILRLRDVHGEREHIEQRIAHIRQHGFANAFGAQRFGHRNLERARQWVARNALPKKRDERAQILSTLRAYLYNLELQARLAHGNAHQLLDGDYAMLCGSHSHFIVAEVSDELRDRCAGGDLAPAGILPGKSRHSTQGSAQSIRAQAYNGEEAILAYLEQHTDADCRPLIARAENLRHQWHDDQQLELRFDLPSGSFATALLADLFDDIYDAANSCV